LAYAVDEARRNLSGLIKCAWMFVGACEIVPTPAAPASEGWCCRHDQVIFLAAMAARQRILTGD
jgi:hypothetical protein